LRFVRFLARILLRPARPLFYGTQEWHQRMAPD
jgi:hypothetical protein